MLTYMLTMNKRKEKEEKNRKEKRREEKRREKARKEEKKTLNHARVDFITKYSKYFSFNRSVKDDILLLFPIVRSYAHSFIRSVVHRNP